MEQIFFQQEWHHINFKDIGHALGDSVAGNDFYSSFYSKFFNKNDLPSNSWTQHKIKVAKWLHQKYLSDPSHRKNYKILSIGAGLGQIEKLLLDQGCHIDLLEPSEKCVQYLTEHFPSSNIFHAEAKSIPCLEGSYDFVCMSAVDYCFKREEYEQVLVELARVLKRGGQFVCLSFSNLSIRNYFKEIAKSVLRKMKNILGKQGHEIAWGYRRTIGEHINLARNSGLSFEEVHCFNSEWDELNSSRKKSLLFAFPSFKDYCLSLTFLKREAP